MRTIKLTLEYDGTAYHGWQRQANAPAIQNAVEDRLKVLLKEPVGLTGAGRTDAGVHARMQVAHFRTGNPIALDALKRGLNGLLPRDIRVTGAEEAPELFDARRDPEQKTYCYQWWDRDADDPFGRRFAWHLGQGLDAEAMQRASQALVGEHDFSSFRAAGCEARHPVRRVLAARVGREGHQVRFFVTATAFLQQMVRIMAGSLTEVGLHRQDEGFLERALAARDRRAAGPTAPPHGLCLWEVRYGAIPRPGRKVFRKGQEPLDNEGCAD
jgi:tRNA pseudouridine38-40 synthase